MKLTGIIYIIVSLFLLGTWPYNAYQLSQCDFEPPYRCEFIHGAGVLVPPIQLAAVWFDTDNK